MGRILLILAAMAALAGSAADFQLVADGRAAARIELIAEPADCPAAEKDIALFNRYLQEVTGMTLPTNGAAARTMRVTVKPITSLTTRHNWGWAFPSPDVMALVATRTSLFTALRHVLEESCDARFLGVEKCMFQYEPRRDASLMRETRRSARRNYSLLRSITNDPGTFRELGVDGDRLFEFSHGVPVAMFPADKYRDGWPEAIMPTYKGQKLKKPKNLFVGWQPCYSNPETVRLAKENVLEYLRKHTDRKNVTLAVNDCCGYCQCEACLAADANARRATFYNANPNRSASVWGFASQVADAVSKEYPELRYGGLAYTGTSEPPEFPINRRIVPMMTMTTAAGGMDPQLEKEQNDLIRRWGEKVDEAGIWEYDWGRTFYIPRVHPALDARRLKYLYEHGGRAYFAENSTDALDGPKIYLKARLLEDVDADPEAILDEWFTRFAGKDAAADLRAIYAACESFWSSPKMKKTAWWRMRGAICLGANEQAYAALTPGFTEGLVTHARAVLAKARTSGEKRRAEVLLRHFQLTDAIMTFRGYAYQTAYAGVVPNAETCCAMIEDFIRRAPAIFADWPKVDAYFSNCDFPRPKWYLSRDIVSLDPVSECAGVAAEIAKFREDRSVAEVYRRLCALKCLPADVRKVFVRACSDEVENQFSNPGLAKSLGTMKVQTNATCRAEIVDCPDLPGGKALRIVPTKADGSQIGFTLFEGLESGTWVASVKVRGGRFVEFAAWRPGIDDGVFAYSEMPKGWKMFSRKNTVGTGQRGLNLNIRATGVGKDGLLLGDIRLVKVADPDPRKSRGTAGVEGFGARCGSKRETVYGEPALVNRSKDAYYFAEFGLTVPFLRPQDTMRFKLRAAVPEGADGGRLGAVLLGTNAEGKFGALGHLFWDRRLKPGAYEDLDFNLKGSLLGRTSGHFRMFFYKIGNAGALALSSLTWDTVRGESAE